MFSSSVGIEFRLTCLGKPVIRFEDFERPKQKTFNRLMASKLGTVQETATKLVLVYVIFTFATLVILPASYRARYGLNFLGISNFDSLATVITLFGVCLLVAVRIIKVFSRETSEFPKHPRLHGQVVAVLGIGFTLAVVAFRPSIGALLGSLQIMLLLLFVFAFSDLRWFRRRTFWVIPPILLCVSSLSAFLHGGAQIETVAALTFPFLAVACLRSIQLKAGTWFAYIFCSFAISANLLVVISGGNRTATILVAIAFLMAVGLGPAKSTVLIVADFLARLVFLATVFSLLFRRQALLLNPTGELYDAGRIQNYWIPLLEESTWFEVRGFGAARNFVLEVTAGADSNPHSSIVAMIHDVGFFWTCFLAMAVVVSLSTMASLQINSFEKTWRSPESTNLIWVSALLMFSAVLAVNYVTEQISLTLAVGLLAIWCAPESSSYEVRRHPRLQSVPCRALITPGGNSRELRAFTLT